MSGLLLFFLYIYLSSIFPLLPSFMLNRYFLVNHFNFFIICYITTLWAFDRTSELGVLFPGYH